MENNINNDREKRLMRINTIKELMLNDNLSAEEIYQKIMDMDPDIMKTKSIYRSETSWKNCIYEGAIGEDDFVVSEASSSSLAYMEDIALKHDDIKETLIKFIDDFRTFLKNNQDMNLLSALIKYLPSFLALDFAGAGRNGNAATGARIDLAEINKESQFREYNISDCKGAGKTAVCVERNSTLGNIFQFCGFETYQISGEMSSKSSEDEMPESHHFLIIKHGPDIGQYSLIDLFNDVTIRNVADGDYDLKNGFRVSNSKYTYRLHGPLIEMTPEMITIERHIRALNGGIRYIDHEMWKYNKHKLDNSYEVKTDLQLEHFKRLENAYKDVMNKIVDSNFNEEFKNRLIRQVTFYIKTLNDKKEKFERNSTNELNEESQRGR